MKGVTKQIFIFLLVVLFHACAGDIGGFQENQSDPDFVLFEMFKNEPALDEIWDVMDQDEMNCKMAEMIRTNKADFVTFSRLNRDIMKRKDILPAMMLNTRDMLKTMFDPWNTPGNRFSDPNATTYGTFYNKTPLAYRGSVYGLVDRIRKDKTGPEMSDSLLAVARGVVSYLKEEKSPAELKTDMANLVDDINDLDQEDFVLLTQNLGKMLAAASYSMRITSDGELGGSIDSGLGNAVKGTHSLTCGLRDRVGTKISDRQLAYDMIEDLRQTLFAPENTGVLKDFITVLESHFTKGGSVYGSAVNTTNTDVNANLYNTSSTNLYSDTELSNTLKETLSAQLGLLLRDDRNGALTSDEDSKSYALERFAQRLRDMGIDWKNSKIEESLYDAITVDAYGRDRRLDYEQVAGPGGTTVINTSRKPYAISFLEDFFFLGGITNNWGWKDGGRRNEVQGTTSFSAVANAHGHGDPTNYITLNDGLFSITSKKELELLGTYELALPDNDTRADHIFRSKNSFTSSETDRNKYRFYYDANYGALDFVSGGALGDLGLPNGGNPNGNTGSTTAILNAYRPYTGNGIDEKELAPWTLGWVARACFEGEGPYYYKDPAAVTITVNDKIYHRYMRPNGKIYAYVHLNSSGNPDEYIYAKDGDYDPIDGTLPSTVAVQRENRYKSTWKTEYFMISNLNNNKFYTPCDMSGDATIAGCLTYNEVIDEYDTVRACASQEEAIFRNYQWVMTEKKFVIIIPMWIRNAGLVITSAVYQITEAHGFAGSAPARKYRENGVWAKANTSGTSKIPGDYRVTLLAAAISGLVSVDADKVYEDTLGYGPAVYSAVYHALAPLYRMGFPRSPLFTEADYPSATYGTSASANFEHTQLGSKQFAASDSDPIWQKRNMILPVLAALVNVIHESGTPLKKTVANFTDGTLPLLKPLFFYNKDIRDYDGTYGVATDSLLPRVSGGATDYTYHYPHSKALIPEQFITDFKGKDTDDVNDPDAYFGGWAVRDYFMAAPMTTLFSSLIDRKPIVQGSNARFSNMTGRSEGLLGMLTKYNINQPRSATNQSQTRIISNLLDQVAKLADPKYDDKSGINYEASNFDTSQYDKWGARRRILYGLEQTMSAGKMTKGRYINILQTLSDRSGGTSANNYNDVAYGGTRTKAQFIPNWIFTKRDVDLDMDGVIDRIVGWDEVTSGSTVTKEGKGIAHRDSTWEADLDDDIEDMSELFDNLLIKGADHYITDNMLDMADIFLSKNMTDDEVAALLYSTGRLFAYYDGGWVWHGQRHTSGDDGVDADNFDFLWHMLKDYLPKVHDIVCSGESSEGANYMVMMTLLQDVLAEDGLGPFLLDITLSANTERLVEDLWLFLGEDFVTESGSMWVTLSNLMDDLADNVESTSEESVAEIYREYGFQQNGY